MNALVILILLFSSSCVLCQIRFPHDSNYGTPDIDFSQVAQRVKDNRRKLCNRIGHQISNGVVSFPGESDHGTNSIDLPNDDFFYEDKRCYSMVLSGYFCPVGLKCVQGRCRRINIM